MKYSKKKLTADIKRINADKRRQICISADSKTLLSRRTKLNLT